MLKKFLKRIIYKNTCDSSHYIKYLEKHGVKIGKNTYFFSPKTTNIDVSNGIFIEIGEKCKITKGVHILAHDYSYSILRPIYHKIPKKAGKTIIGNNVFIGINSIILMGANIGDNVIIGAGSVVSGKIPSNQVWGGNPAKFICSLEDYYKKTMNKYEDSAKLFVREFKNKNNRCPSIKELQYFSLLFLNDDEKEILKEMSFNGDEKEEVFFDCNNIKNKYKNYDDFIEACLK